MVNTKPGLKTLWQDRLTVTKYQKVIRPDKSTGFEEVIVLSGEPCKLSFTTLQSTDNADGEARLVQVAKLFLDNAVKIKPGSKLTVQRRDEVFEYSQSGLPGVFTNHQEIVIVPFKGWA